MHLCLGPWAQTTLWGLFVLLFVAAAPCLGAVYFLAQNGDDSGPYPDTGTYTLVDDGEWHEITLDARTVREGLEGIRYLRLFRFYTHRNAKKGQEFWFDEFEILPG